MIILKIGLLENIYHPINLNNRCFISQLLVDSLSNNFLLHLSGDLQNEESVLEWLIDDDNRELADEIESVNERMLERLLEESPFLAVFFCKL